MKLKVHFFIILLLSIAMTVYLYSYKPRSYDSATLVFQCVKNIAVWLLIFGGVYAVIAFIVTAIRSR